MNLAWRDTGRSGSNHPDCRRLQSDRARQSVIGLFHVANGADIGLRATERPAMAMKALGSEATVRTGEKDLTGGPESVMPRVVEAGRPGLTWNAFDDS